MPRYSAKQVDSQRLWEDQINRAKKVRESWKKLFKVDMGIEYYDGKQNPGYPESDWITINKIYSHLKARLPALYAADPYFYVKPKKSYTPNPMDIALYEKRAKIRQAYLNYLKGELKLKQKARLCIQDAHFAYGVLKSHYVSDEFENPDAGKPMMDAETPLIGEDGQPLIEPETIPVNGKYKFTRVHPDDFLWGEDAGPLEDDWPWVAQRIRETFDKAEKNPRYSKVALKTIRGTSEISGDEEKKREERKKGSDVKGRSEQIKKTKKPSNIGKPDILVAWEIYNLAENTWLIIAEGAEIPLREEGPLPVGIENHPFSILRFTMRDDSPYPIPPVSPGLDPAREYNQARSDIQKHRKRFNRKYEAVESQLADESELDKLESGGDGTVIRVLATGTVSPIQDAQIDQTRYQELAYLGNEMTELFGGTSDESRGIAGADSATQAGILDKRLEIKEGDAMSEVVDWITTAASKMDQLVQANITGDEAVKVVGPQGEYWEMVRESDYQKINGEFEYTVNVGATIPQMPQVERSSWMAFLGLLANFPQLLLSKRLFKRMAEMHHIEDEAMLDEVYAIGKMMMSGQLPMPGQQGSQPNVGETRPVSAVGGMSGGFASLGQPGAGNLQQ